MKMIKCKNCDEKYSVDLPNCPYCFEKNNNYIKNRKTIGIVLFALAGISLVILVSMLIINKDELFDTPQSQSFVEESKAAVNYENFEKIEIGMTYDQVVKILGEEGKILTDVDMGLGDEYRTTTYYWYDYTEIANCNVTFQDGKVIAKAQIGLD